MLFELLSIKIKGLLSKQINNKQSKKFTLFIALLFIYVFIVMFFMFYYLFNELSMFCKMNLSWLYFSIMSLIAFIVCFIGSVFMCKNEIYEAKDNELLFSMPISKNTILWSRLLFVLFVEYVFELFIVIPAEIVFIKVVGFSILQFISYLLVIISLPFLVLTITMLLSYLLTIIINKIRFKTLFSLIISIIAFVLYIFGVQYIEHLMAILIQNGQSIAKVFKKFFYPLYHLGNGVVGDIGSLIVYLLFVLIPFILVYYLLINNYSSLSLSKGKEEKSKEIKYTNNSLRKSLVIKEIKRCFSNATLILNGFMGNLMCIIALVSIYLNKESLLLIINQLDQKMLLGIIILSMLSISSFNTISGALISLEGNNLWIIKSLPVKIKDILESKLLFCLIMSLPFYLVTVSFIYFSFFDNIIYYGILLLAVIIFSLFSSLLGLLSNLWKVKLDWLNEVYCVKQSLPIFIMMFTPMLLVLVIFIGYLVLINLDIIYYISLVLFLFILLDIYLYHCLMTWGVDKFSKLS